jgi:hypothetical protein
VIGGTGGVSKRNLFHAQPLSRKSLDHGAL